MFPYFAFYDVAVVELYIPLLYFQDVIFTNRKQSSL